MLVCSAPDVATSVAAAVAAQSPSLQSQQQQQLQRHQQQQQQQMQFLAHALQLQSQLKAHTQSQPGGCVGCYVCCPQFAACMICCSSAAFANKHRLLRHLLACHVMDLASAVLLVGAHPVPCMQACDGLVPAAGQAGNGVQ